MVVSGMPGIGIWVNRAEQYIDYLLNVNRQLLTIQMTKPTGNKLINP
jgi:hypothetical protein